MSKSADTYKDSDGVRWVILPDIFGGVTMQSLAQSSRRCHITEHGVLYDGDYHGIPADVAEKSIELWRKGKKK